MSSNKPTMLLIGARVTNYGCFRDSGEVPLDKVTALLAENENGKSTFLRALSWWGSSDAFDEEDRWTGADPDVTLDLVALTFELTPPAAAVLHDAGVQVTDQIRIIRDSVGARRAEVPSTGHLIERDEQVLEPVDTTLLDAAKEAAAQYLRTHASAVPATAPLVDELLAAVPGTGTIEGAVQRLLTEVMPLVGPVEQGPLGELLTNVVAAATPPPKPPPLDIYGLLRPYLPVLIYFDESVDFVRDAITYAEVAVDPAPHRTMINLATLAGIDLVQVATLTPHARQQASRVAEQTLSTDFSKYWQGERVTVFAQVDESQMTLTIEHKGRTQRPSRRSSGLKWQLGFFVNFTAETKGELSNAVLLLDEPGLHLHVKQQPKLLELFDDLARDGCRIIYATHLSHMLAPDRPHTFRPLIADPETPGATTVVANITALPSKSDVMQPIRQALGLGIADAIGLGGVNVIAEGWSERYVLLAMSELCRAAGRSCLSPATTVLPAGGSGKKMLPLAAMAVAEKTKAIALVDDDKAGRDTANLVQGTLPGAISIVRTQEDVEPTGLELEDVFSREMYLELVNAAHASVPNYKPIDIGELDPAKPICDAIEASFRANGLGKFQKLKPAIELQKWIDLEKDPDSVTLDRFAALFDRLRAALAQA